MKRGHDIHVCGDGGDVTTCTRRRVELLGGGAQGAGGVQRGWPRLSLSPSPTGPSGASSLGG
jgi:hypothetical protein